MQAERFKIEADSGEQVEPVEDRVHDEQTQRSGRKGNAHAA